MRREPSQERSIFHPEDRARETIDAQLAEAGWVVQSRDRMNLGAGLGVAVREFADRLRPGRLRAVRRPQARAAWSRRSRKARPSRASRSRRRATWGACPSTSFADEGQVRFEYVASGTEILFRDHADPDPRSRRVFTFHRPETLRALADRADDDPRPAASRCRRSITDGLRDCQVDAVPALESSLAAEPSARADPDGDRRRQDVHRLHVQLSAARTREIPAHSVSRRPRQSRAPDARRVRRLSAARHRPVVYRTLQCPEARAGRARQGRRGRHRHDPARLFGADRPANCRRRTRRHRLSRSVRARPQRLVAYNPAIPIESFDLVITDECHRSIYGTWRQVLEYFDAFIVGLTATPSLHTMGFFGKNLVAQYPYERSVADGVNVGFEIYPHPHRDRRARRQRSRSGYEVCRSATSARAPSATRADRGFRLHADQDSTARCWCRTRSAPCSKPIATACSPSCFPAAPRCRRRLIFGKDDHHAEEIVGIVREVFGKGNDFAKKITYRTDGGDPEQLIRAIPQRLQSAHRRHRRHDRDRHRREAAGGADLPARREVGALFRADEGPRRAHHHARRKLREVTPDAEAKTRFVLIDAVGVTESLKTRLAAAGARPRRSASTG